MEQESQNMLPSLLYNIEAQRAESSREVESLQKDVKLISDKNTILAANYKTIITECNLNKALLEYKEESTESVIDARKRFLDCAAKIYDSAQDFEKKKNLYEKEVAEVDILCAEVEEDLQDVRRNLANKKEFLQKKLVELEVEQAVNVEEENDLKTKILEMNKKLAEATNENEKYLAEFSELNMKFEELEELNLRMKNGANNTEDANSSKSYENLADTTKALEENIRELENMIGNANNEGALLDNDIKKLENEEVEYKRIIVGLEKHTVTTQKTLEDIDENILSVESQNKELTESLEQIVTSKEKEIMTYTVEINEYKQFHEQNDEEIEKMQNQLEETKKYTDETKQYIIDQEAELVQKTNELQELEEMIRKEKETLQKMQNDYETELLAKKDEEAFSQNDIKHFRETTNKTLLLVEELTATINKLKEVESQTKEKIQTQVLEKNVLDKKIKDLTMKLEQQQKPQPRPQHKQKRQTRHYDSDSSLDVPNPKFIWGTIKEK